MIERRKLEEIVGAENVLTDEATLASYSHDMSFAPRVKPEAVVRPLSADEVRRLVSLAGETHTPLVPVSSGPPHFRGDTVPSTGGAIALDLGRMKRIIHIDRKNRVAMFEPGVTFDELSAALRGHGMRLNMPLLPRKTKSVLGSLLEREPPVMPKYHWDNADPLTCTEIVFGNGEVFRTGSAAGSGTIEEQWAAGGAQKEAAGPSAFSLYRVIQGAQGTMGVVTWATARCEILPVLEEPFFVGSSDLDRLLDGVHWLVRLRLVNECFILNRTDFAVITSAAKKDLPEWVLFFNLAAYDLLPDLRMKGQLEDMQALLQRLSLTPVKSVGGMSAGHFLRLVQKPSEEPYWKLRPGGAFHDVFFITVSGRLQEMVGAVYGEVSRAGYPVAELGIYLQPVVQGTSFHAEFSLFYDPHRPDEVMRLHALSCALTERLLSRGAFFSRPYGEHAGLIMNRDAATFTALKKVKAIFDPGNIMNPGKLGL
ncbi:MAG: FAD-binding oxidoreductase [Dehalococcoidales bacterium]|nr:FAD-binding oxidoreductase [Dehalococcoidales bacterium]